MRCSEKDQVKRRLPAAICLPPKPEPHARKPRKEGAKRGLLQRDIRGATAQTAKNLLRRQGISATKVKKLAKPLFGGNDKISATESRYLLH